MDWLKFYNVWIVEKEIGKNFKSMGSVRGSSIVQWISSGKGKSSSAPYSARNELEMDKNLMQPYLDLIEEETSFPRDNLEVMEDSPRSKSGS